MKVANTERLLAEELIDLLYELNEINNVKTELEFDNHDLRLFTLHLNKLRSLTALVASFLSGIPDYRLLDETSQFNEQEGFIDIGDLIYLTGKANKNLIVTYGTEMSDQNRLLIELIEYYLIKMKEYVKV